MTFNSGEVRIQQLLHSFIDQPNNLGFIKFSNKDLGRLLKTEYDPGEKFQFNVTFISSHDIARGNDIKNIVSAFKKDKIFKINEDGAINLPARIAEKMQELNVNLNFKNYSEQHEKIQRIFHAIKEPVSEDSIDSPPKFAAEVKTMTKEEEAEFHALKEKILELENQQPEQKTDTTSARPESPKSGGTDIKREIRNESKNEKSKTGSEKKAETKVTAFRQDDRHLDEKNRLKEEERDLRDIQKRVFFKEQTIKKERTGR